MEDSSSCFFLYKAALVFALIRWALSWASKLRSRRSEPQSPSSPSFPSSSKISPHMIRQNLALTTYGDIVARHGHGQADSDACAVCLSQLREADEVRELRNCSHVFHRECIDRWVDHDGSVDLDPGYDCDDDDENGSNHKSCPLCRAPLLTTSQWVDRWVQPDPEPSWAVERILYLFGDDLLC